MGIPNNIDAERSIQALSHLREIVIRSFPNDLDDTTPSTHSSCLPTPPRDPSRNLVQHPVHVSAPSLTPLNLSYSPEDYTPPPAPLLKDCDSFSAGSGNGTFDFLPSDDDEIPASSVPVAVAEERENHTEPPQDDLETFRQTIESWRLGVSLGTSIPLFGAGGRSPLRLQTKRPRSNTSSDEYIQQEKAKRTRRHFRPRARSLNYISSSLNSFAWDSQPREFSARNCPHSHFAVG